MIHLVRLAAALFAGAAAVVALHATLWGFDWFDPAHRAHLLRLWAGPGLRGGFLAAFLAAPLGVVVVWIAARPAFEAIQDGALSGLAAGPLRMAGRLLRALFSLVGRLLGRLVATGASWRGDAPAPPSLALSPTSPAAGPGPEAPTVQLAQDGRTDARRAEDGPRPDEALGVKAAAGGDAPPDGSHPESETTPKAEEERVEQAILSALQAAPGRTPEGAAGSHETQSPFDARAQILRLLGEAGYTAVEGRAWRDDGRACVFGADGDRVLAVGFAPAATADAFAQLRRGTAALAATLEDEGFLSDADAGDDEGDALELLSFLATAADAQDAPRAPTADAPPVLRLPERPDADLEDLLAALPESSRTIADRDLLTLLTQVR